MSDLAYAIGVERACNRDHLRIEAEDCLECRRLRSETDAAVTAMQAEVERLRAEVAGAQRLYIEACECGSGHARIAQLEAKVTEDEARWAWLEALGFSIELRESVTAEVKRVMITRAGVDMLRASEVTS